MHRPGRSGELAERSVAEAVSARRWRKEAHLHKIEQVNARIQAVVQLDAEGALQSATAAADSLSRGVAVGASRGVPTLNDCIET
jgi:amidase